MKAIIISFLFLVCSTLQAQVSSVSFFNRYEQQTDSYTMLMYINAGSAVSAARRTQFNAQISVVADSSTTIEIIESLNPLQNNFEVNTGTVPATWSVSSTIDSPSITPDKSYHSIVPTLSPTSRYNILLPGDCVELFRYRAIGCEGDCARLYINGTDPTNSDTGMANSDFSNGMTFGSPSQLFTSILVEDLCGPEITSTADLPSNMSIYPNPATDFITVTNTAAIDNIQITNLQGQVLQSILGDRTTVQQIDLSGIPAGTYTVTVTTSTGLNHQLITLL